MPDPRPQPLAERFVDKLPYGFKGEEARVREIARHTNEFRKTLGRKIDKQEEWDEYRETHNALHNDMRKTVYPEVTGIDESSHPREYRESRVEKVSKDIRAVDSIKDSLEDKRPNLELMGRGVQKDVQALEINRIMKELVEDRQTLIELRAKLQHKVDVFPFEEQLSQIDAWLQELREGLRNADVKLASLVKLKDLLGRGPSSGDEQGLLYDIEAGRDGLQGLGGEDELVKKYEVQHRQTAEVLDTVLLKILEHDDNPNARSFIYFKRHLEMLEKDQNEGKFNPNNMQAPQVQDWILNLSPGVRQLEELIEEYGAAGRENLSIAQGLTMIRSLHQRGARYLDILRQRLASLPAEAPMTAAVPTTASDRRESTKVDPGLTKEQVGKLTYKQLVDAIIRANINPYDPDTSRITNPVNEALVVRFQKFDIPPLDEKEKQERLQWKIKLFCTRYTATHTGAEDMPAANTDDVLKLMESGNWDLARVELLSMAKDPLYGETVKEMWRYAIDIVARRADDRVPPWYRPDARLKNFVYGKIGLTLEGKKPKERLMEELKRAFIDEAPVGQKLPQEVFDVAWGMFYTYDLFGVSLALQQKWTQTRAHNTHQKSDPNDRSRPLHVATHKLNRYGGRENSGGWLLLFTSKYPDSWVNSMGKKGMQSKQEQVKKYVESLMPTDGIEGTIYPEPTDAKNFIRFWSNEKLLTSVLPTSEARTALLKPLKDARDLNQAGAINKAKEQIATVVYGSEMNAAKANFVLECLPQQDKKKVLSSLREVNTPDQRMTIVNRYYDDPTWYAFLHDRMWDLSVFPDQLEFITEDLADGDVQNMGNFNAAVAGWDTMRAFTKGELIKGKKEITRDDVFRQDGLWDSFIGGGIGKAKMVKWRHHAWFVPMTRYFIGRIAQSYVAAPGQDDVDALRELSKELVERLDIAIKEGEGLRGLDGFEELRNELLLRSERSGSQSLPRRAVNVVAGFAAEVTDKYADLPPLMIPWEARGLPAYKEYCDLLYEEKNGVTPPNTLGRRFSPFSSGRLNTRRDYREWINRETFPPLPLSREIDTDTTKK